MEYKEINALNQSILKKILISPQSFLQAQKKQAEPDDSSEEHFVFGSVVDIMLTGSREEFEKKFVKIPDETKCSDTIKGIIKEVYNDIAMSDAVDDSLDNYKLKVLEYANYANYQSNWKDDTRIDKIIKEGESYFELLKTIGNKTPITETDYAKAVVCVMALKGNKFTKPYTVLKSSPNNREFLDKFIIEFDYVGLKIKGELDRIVIDHTDKTITPIDFKTTGKPITGFVGDFWYYRYDFQSVVYLRGLYEHPDIKKLLESNYSLNPFLYIAVETNLVNQPMIFEVGEEASLIGFFGGIVNNKKYEGFEKAIERYQYAVVNNAWDYPMEYYENKKIVITV
jgi:hypothetical protein